MSILINRMIIEGELYKRTLPFSKGLNVIEGEIHSGKSLLLNLIDYSLGKSKVFKGNVQPELKNHCDRVFLEVVINDEILTIERNLWKDHDYVFVYFCEFNKIKNYTPRVLNIDEYCDFLFEKLEIPQFKLLKYKQHSQERTLERISFRDLMRYVYVDQHELGTKIFMKMHDPLMKRKNKTLFEILFEFIEFDDNKLVEEIKEISNKIEILKKQIEGLKAYLQETNIHDRVELTEIYREYETQLKEAEKEKNNIISNLKNKNSRTNSLYAKTKEKINKLFLNINELQQKRNDLNLTKESKALLLHNYEREYTELAATREVYEKIPVEMHKYKCPLCSTELQLNNQCVTKDDISDVIYHLKNKIDTLKEAISKVNEIDDSIQKEIALLEEEKTLYVQALYQYESQINTPYIPEIESLNKLINDIQDKMNKVNEMVRMYNKIDEKEVGIKQLESKLSDLRQKQNDLKVLEEDKNKTILALSKNYNSIMNSLKIRSQESYCYINSTDYLPEYKGANIVEHDSGGILVCMQIAYLLTILNYAKANTDFKHPGFLMFDTIGKYLGTYLEQMGEEFTEDMIMDPITYAEIYKVLIDLSKEYQLFVVDNTPHHIARPYVQYTFYNHDFKGLIDLNKNEK